MERTRPASNQARNQGHHRFGRTAASTPGTDAAALPRMRYASGGLCVDGLARPITRQDSPTTPEHSPKDVAYPDSVGVQDGSHRNPRSGGEGMML